MTSDDQQFLDLLASIPADVAHYGGRMADYIEKHTNAIANDIRGAIDAATWIPESIKPPRSQAAHHFFQRTPPPPKSWYDKPLDFVSKNRTVIAVVVAFAGTTFYLVHRRRKEHARKRRAKKLPTGAKKEIVVLACSTFHDPLTRSLALDLERRGYVVYVTVSSTEEDSLIQQESRIDLRPLWTDLTTTVTNPDTDTHPSLEPILHLLTKSPSSPSTQSMPRTSSKSSNGSSLSNMTLAGIIVFPGCSGYPTGNLSSLHPSDVVDSINTRLLSPILTVQQFLPLLTRHSSTTDRRSPANIIIAYPSIPQSLTPPTQIPETVITSSLSSLASSLRHETHISDANIAITEIKMGNFDLASIPQSKAAMYRSRTLHHHQKPDPSSREYVSSQSSSQLTLTHNTTHWHSSQRAAHTRSTNGQSSNPLIRGSSAREFHNAVFDALAPSTHILRPFGIGLWGSSKLRIEVWAPRKKSRVVYVGQGARLYDLVGKWGPSGLVGRSMGYRRRRDEVGSQGINNSVYGLRSVHPGGSDGYDGYEYTNARRGSGGSDEEEGGGGEELNLSYEEGMVGTSGVWAGQGSSSGGGGRGSSMWEKV